MKDGSSFFHLQKRSGEQELNKRGSSETSTSRSKKRSFLGQDAGTVVEEQNRALKVSKFRKRETVA